MALVKFVGSSNSEVSVDSIKVGDKVVAKGAAVELSDSVLENLAQKGYLFEEVSRSELEASESGQVVGTDVVGTAPEFGPDEGANQKEESPFDKSFDRRN